MINYTAVRVQERRLEELDFEPIEERWNEYELLDENVYVRLRGRIILVKLFRNPAGKSQYGMKLHKVFAVSSPRKGVPMKPPTPAEIKKMEKYPVEIVSSREPWNIYKVVRTGELLRVKLIVTDVYRLRGYYDSEGEPFYVIHSGSLVSKGKGRLPTA